MTQPDNPNTPMIQLDHVSVTLGTFQAVRDLTLHVARGEFLVLIGTSGSGKSTVLRLMNRLLDATAGTVRFNGQDVAAIPPEILRRQIGYVIQGGGLFPHWTVARNIATVPTLLGWPRPRIEARIDALLALLQLDPARLRDAYPHQLSGGQQQRVGVARALAADPAILLMDEPFGALDPLTRADLQAEMRRIHRDTGTTVVFVTHDMEEATSLATRIALIDRGALVQLGTPLDILATPANDLVRTFIGTRDRGLKLLALETAATRMRPGADRTLGPPIRPDTPLAEALSEMVLRHTDRLSVATDPPATLHLQDIVHPPS